MHKKSELNSLFSYLVCTIYKFRRYEDASLEYTGINRHRGEHVGLFDTALAAGEYAVSREEEVFVEERE